MRLALKLTLAFALSLIPLLLSAQGGAYDVFNPISKYISAGDAEKLSAWFADNLEVSIFSNSNNSSKNQAKLIMKSFFESNTPRSFNLTHATGRGDIKYAMGTLIAGGENFLVTIFVSKSSESYKIQQIKIERIQ